MVMQVQGAELNWCTYQNCYSKYGVSEKLLAFYAPVLVETGREVVDVEEVEYDYAVELLREVYSHFFDEEVADGVIYYLLDTMVLFGPQLTSYWFKQTKTSTPEGCIMGMELYRRRRCRSDVNWNAFGPAWTNRANRSRAQALKMLRVGA